MKIKKYINKYKLLLVVVCCTLALVGCQSDNKTTDANIENNQIIDEITAEKDSNSEINPAESKIEESTLLFSELLKYKFVFSNGVGAWQTMLNINEDGTFKGEYSDSDMGVTGEDYPDGTIYSSTFEGKFTTPKKINDYTYSISIEYINIEKEVGSEEIIDGIKYIYSEPYGLDAAKEIYIYTPQAPLKELPEGFLSWVNMALNDGDEYLKFYGLYNIETESGFSSYEID